MKLTKKELLDNLSDWSEDKESNQIMLVEWLLEYIDDEEINEKVREYDK